MVKHLGAVQAHFVPRTCAMELSHLHSPTEAHQHPTPPHPPQICSWRSGDILWFCGLEMWHKGLQGANPQNQHPHHTCAKTMIGNGRTSLKVLVQDFPCPGKGLSRFPWGWALSLQNSSEDKLKGDLLKDLYWCNPELFFPLAKYNRCQTAIWVTSLFFLTALLCYKTKCSNSASILFLPWHLAHQQRWFRVLPQGDFPPRSSPKANTL